MKTSYKFFAVLMLASALGACTKLLEVRPISSISSASYWNSEGDVLGYMTGMYSDLRGLMNSTYHFEDRADHLVVGLEGPGSDAWEQNLNDANAPSWVDHYNLIHHANLVLKYGPEIQFGNENNKRRVLAEAHFMRAYVYFLLTKSWGKVPVIVNPTESDNEPLPARAPVDEVMNLIISDVNHAIGLFPEAGFVHKSKSSKPAAYALKANAYLWKAKVQNGGTASLDSALAAVDKAKEFTSLATDFASIFSSATKNNQEVIFSIHFQRDERSDHYGSRLKPRDIFINSAANKDQLPYANLGARSTYAPSTILQNSFAANDRRRDLSFIRAVETGGNVIGVFDNKFRGTFYTDALDRIFDDNIIIYRHADMILLKAEILAALNNPGDAVTELNLVRNRAGIGNYTGATDKLSVEREILNERGRELYLELKRWHDLVRFHYGGTIDIYAAVPKLNGLTIPLYFPIRATWIDLNSNLEQTEGY